MKRAYFTNYTIARRALRAVPDRLRAGIVPLGPLGFPGFMVWWL